MSAFTQPQAAGGVRRTEIAKPTAVVVAVTAVAIAGQAALLGSVLTITSAADVIAEHVESESTGLELDALAEATMDPLRGRHYMWMFLGALTLMAAMTARKAGVGRACSRRSRC